MLYWRPVVPGLNTSAAHLSQARELSRHAHATVFTGLFYREQIAAYYRDHDLPEPYDDTARRKILPEAAEQQILATFRDPQDSGAPWGPLFRKTSCAVAYATAKPTTTATTASANSATSARPATSRSPNAPSSWQDSTSHPGTSCSTASATRSTPASTRDLNPEPAD